MESRISIRTGGLFSRLFLLFLLLFLLPCSASGASTEQEPAPTRIRIGFYENPPKLYIDHKGEPGGIFPEIIKYIASRENWQVEWVPGNWHECLQRLELGQIDIMPDVAFSLQRSKKFAFTDEPVFLNWATVYTSPESTVSSLIDLEGLRVAVMRGSIHTEGKEGIKNQVANFKIDCEFLEFSSYKEVFQAVQNGLADAGVVNRLFGTISGPSYDLSPTSVMFNPRHIKFAFPSDGLLAPTLKQTIDVYLRAANTDPKSPVKQIITAFFKGVPVDWSFQQGDTRRVYLTEKEKNWIKNHPTIRLGVDPEFAPFEFINENGQYSGYGADYVRLLNERLGLNMEIVPEISWQEVISRLQDRRIDVLPAAGYTAERSSYLKYSTPYIGFHRVIISHIGNPFVSGLADITGLRIGVQANSSHSGWLKEKGPLKIHEYDTLAQTLQAVSKGNVDVMIGNLAACTYLIRGLHITNLKVASPLSSKRQLLHFAIRKDWPELVSIIDKGLASITSEESERIRNRWTAAGFNVGIPAEIMWKRIALLVITASVLIGMFWAWSLRLKREVSRREAVEQELQEAGKELENRVKRRTAELEEANQALKTEMENKLRLEQKLHRSQKMETIGLMAGGVAHDLNNILTSISCYPDLLLMKLPEDNELRPLIQDIRFSSRQAAEVVSDLLTVARGSIGTRTAACLNDIIEGYLHSPEHKKTVETHDKVSFTTDLTPSKTTIICSPVHIRKCLMNLINNGAEAINGPGEVFIKTELVRHTEAAPTIDGLDDGEYIKLAIIDSGPGIEAKHSQRIFEPFYSKKVMGKRSGSGLGLTVVWNAVHDHGGHINVVSDKKGTTFNLYFPASHEQVSLETSDISIDQLKGDGEKVVIVDDEESQRFIVGKLLEQLNYSVHICSSGEKGIEYLRRNSADLVLIDLVMAPGIDGKQTYEQITEIHPDQKAILLSGLGDCSRVNEAMELGFNSFLKKPFSLVQLGLAIKTVLSENGKSA